MGHEMLRLQWRCVEQTIQSDSQWIGEITQSAEPYTGQSIKTIVYLIVK